jgi:hypothetical protein
MGPDVLPANHTKNAKRRKLDNNKWVRGAFGVVLRRWLVYLLPHEVLELLLQLRSAVLAPLIITCGSGGMHCVFGVMCK